MQKEIMKQEGKRETQEHSNGYQHGSRRI